MGEFGEVDCTDDYESEKKEVLAVGLAKQFERSDWLMKALLGPVSKKFDAWDMGAQAKVKSGAAPSGVSGVTSAPASAALRQPLVVDGRQVADNGTCKNCKNCCIL